MDGRKCFFIKKEEEEECELINVSGMIENHHCARIKKGYENYLTGYSWGTKYPHDAQCHLTHDLPIQKEKYAFTIGICHHPIRSYDQL